MLRPLLKVKLRILFRSLQEILNAPLLRTLTISIFVLGMVYFCYAFAHYIFILLNGIEGAGPFLSNKLLGLFFMSLFFLLTFSQAISGYSTIFKSREIESLLVQPLSYQEIFKLKFLESTLLTSWAFMVIIFPFIYAFFEVKKISLFYLPYVLLYILPFIFLTALLGILLTLALIYLMPKRDLRPYLMAILTALILASIIYFRLTYLRKDVSSKDEIIFFLSQLMPYFNISQQPYLPSYWLSKAMLLLSQDRIVESLFYFWILLINAILFYKLLMGLVPFLYYPCLSSLSIGSGKMIKSRNLGWSIFRRLFPFLGPREKELVIKDLKRILRDPVQYYQILIFFGILAVYFTNLQGRYYQTFPLKWKIFISFLNLSAVNLVLASLAIRFVFPLISLEGKRMWILNLAPISRGKMLFAKFIGLSFFALLINLGLITLSNLMLQIDKEFIRISSWGSLVSSFSIIGIILGAGSCFPNFKEDNPSRIIAGFGGTFALIISLLYVGLMVILLAWPFQFHMLGRLSYQQLRFYNTLTCLSLTLFSFLLVVVFLSRGKKTLEGYEF